MLLNETLFKSILTRIHYDNVSSLCLQFIIITPCDENCTIISFKQQRFSFCYKFKMIILNTFMIIPSGYGIAISFKLCKQKCIEIIQTIIIAIFRNVNNKINTKTITSLARYHLRSNVTEVQISSQTYIYRTYILS